MDTQKRTTPTFRYYFLIGTDVVYRGITTDLERREREHQSRWPQGRIKAVGEPTTHAEAWAWEQQENGGTSTHAG